MLLNDCRFFFRAALSVGQLFRGYYIGKMCNYLHRLYVCYVHAKVEETYFRRYDGHFFLLVEEGAANDWHF